MRLLGEPVIDAGDIFVVTYPQPLTREQAKMIKERWYAVVGGDKKLVVLDHGAQIARLSAVESTPIYDQLVAERLTS